MNKIYRSFLFLQYVNQLDWFLNKLSSAPINEYK